MLCVREIECRISDTIRLAKCDPARFKTYHFMDTRGLRRAIKKGRRRKLKSLHVFEGLFILQTDLVDQICVDNDALP
jgi:hypothetical protein